MPLQNFKPANHYASEDLVDMINEIIDYCNSLEQRLAVLEGRNKPHMQSKQQKLPKQKKIRGSEKHKGFRLIPDSSGIIINGIYVKEDKSEMIIESAFGGRWHFRPIQDGETSY